MGHNAKNVAYIQLPNTAQMLGEIGPLIACGITDANPKARGVESNADINAQATNKCD